MSGRRRIALYHPWIYLRGGIERTIVELVTRSRHDWTLFTSHYRPEDTFPEFSRFNVVRLSGVSVERNVRSVAAACLKLLMTGPGIKSYDALMISSEGIGNLLSFRVRGVPQICLCHTPLKVAYDAYHRERWLRMQQPGLATRAGVRLFTLVDRLTWRRYNRIFCTGREVERRLLNAGLARPGQIAIAHPGVDVDTLRPTGRREPFFLWLGRIKWWKNPELAIEAFREYRRSGGDMRLTVAGVVDDGSRSYFQGLKAAYGGPDVNFIVPSGDDQLHDLIDRSTAVLCTTPNEDWGIVPLEAMAFGKPVIAVDRGGPTESVLNGETGFLCDESPRAFADAMSMLARDPELQGRMSRAARQRSERYHWRHFVEPIDEYIDGLPQQSGVEVPQAANANVLRDA
ncbi:MAG TPA: glycosyltransferase family 4 protein [Dehalococcoidia bacterium]|nr:glycosyltransferase family 4 protein [Dehalococcoidia bacterium]